MSVELPRGDDGSIGWTAARLGRHVELALDSVGVSAAQYRTLIQLAQGSEAATSLARKLAVSAPSVTTVVEGLVQRGAIERHHSTEDRRSISLELTEVGLGLLADADRSVSARLASIAAELDSATAKRAVAGLALWDDALDRTRARRLAQPHTPSAGEP